MTGPRGWGGRLGGAGAEEASGADTATLTRESPLDPWSASWNLGGRAAPRGRRRLSGVVPMRLAEKVSASCGDSAALRPRWAWGRVCGRRGAGNRSGLPERPGVERRGTAGSVRLAEVWDQRAIGSYHELFAASLGNLEWLRFCLNRTGGEIPADDKGFTAIHFAAQSGELACLQVLVEEYKFPADLPTNSGQTPLHLAIHSDNKTMALPCIHYLIKQGAALNTQTCNGSTPLHLAASEGLLSCVKVLVQKGANVHAQDAMGCKPIDYCKIWNHRICARFLKDAMWKQDKKDFAREMGKLKRLKNQLALMEEDYLTEYQKEHQILREADFKKWLHRKLLPQGQSLVRNTQGEPRPPPQATVLSKTPKHGALWPPRSFYPSREARLQQTLQPSQPSVMPIPTCKPMVRRPKVWNLSNNPVRSPTAQIGYSQGIRLGVHPDPRPEHDFRCFLEVRSDGHGGALLRTVAGTQVAPVPRLPLEVIIRELYPSVQPRRMKVPQGFCFVTMREVPRKRRLGDGTFWTDALSMNLRETFDEGFLAAVRAHQGLPTLPSPKPPPHLNLFW
ncbi:LOW QUALITY PROTEIN: ankyrin repeat domain-containing protein 53 [Mesoplodon densirostris]|uniref:LOW QUALITY PROTEIN: ankyrin repeat domain-containing protein 53 n=1 Tax=Mesoplodon densirostris TaxID=48708 RepID=UPI0028DC3140|nr:LOW QUALITY PROTEIN: ankyrin repeat domain-containing protein 53 [Mesoplodon densirostris]